MHCILMGAYAQPRRTSRAKKNGHPPPHETWPNVVRGDTLHLRIKHTLMSMRDDAGANHCLR